MAPSSSLPDTLPPLSEGIPALRTAIAGQLATAANELLVRAVRQKDPLELLIEDKKQKTTLSGNLELPRSGILQDCEFGLAILLVQSALSESGALTGPIADRENVKAVIVSLLRWIVRSITDSTKKDSEFLEGRLGGSPVFFTSAPYTPYKLDYELGYPAILDAAMLTTAFFAQALWQFDGALKAEKPAHHESMESDYEIESLRDDALFVCKEGLRYALSCRLEEDGVFSGLSAAPYNKEKADPIDQMSKEDRLFFAWTTCETLRELAYWRKNYLERIEANEATARLIERITELLKELDPVLVEASAWCRRLFYNDCVAPTMVHVQPIVDEFEECDRKGKKPTGDAEKRKRVSNFCDYVFTISHYAAIRSIKSDDLSLAEVRGVATSLDQVVRVQVLESGLDRSRNDQLIWALTRIYKLGSISKIEYPDDAYYPLVVRSLAGLLSRTLQDLREGEDEASVRSLVDFFHDALHFHCNRMLERRPDDDEDQDLWSYAVGDYVDSEYVLYATQRTLFALIEYLEFLEEVEKAQLGPRFSASDVAGLEQKLVDLLARNFAKSLIGPEVAGLLAAIGPGNSLPQNRWVKDVLSSWLTAAQSYLDSDKFEPEVLDYATRLIRIWEIWREVEGKEPAKGNKRRYETTEGTLQRIFQMDGLGDRLNELYESGSWEREEVASILASYALQEMLPKPETILDATRFPVWKDIETLSKAAEKLSEAETDTSDGA